MKSPSGYICGYTGTSGRHVPGATGRKGSGRASTCRSYTVHAVRLSDGKRVERTIGPGYHSKGHWQEERERVLRELLVELGSRP